MKGSLRNLKYLMAACICAIWFLRPCAVMADAASYWYDYLDTSYDVVVSASDGYVNFRYGPDTTYDIICEIPNGTYLTVEAEGDEKRDHDYHWGEVQYKGDYGWIALSQVTVVESSVPVREEETSKESGLSSSDHDEVKKESKTDKDEEASESISEDEDLAEVSEEATEEASKSDEEDRDKAKEASEEVNEDAENKDKSGESSEKGISFKHKIVLIALIVIITASAAGIILLLLLFKKK